jgi:hypothetical protein
MKAFESLRKIRLLSMCINNNNKNMSGSTGKKAKKEGRE